MFPGRDLRLEPPEYFATESPDADRMSYVQLRRYISDLRASGFNVVPQTVALHRKISFPFVTLIMTLIAVPFAVTTGRRGALYGIAVGIVLAVVYWLTTNAFGAIGSAGMLAPVLAAWAPNLIFGAGAAYLLLDGPDLTPRETPVAGRCSRPRQGAAARSSRTSSIHSVPRRPVGVLVVSTTNSTESISPEGNGHRRLDRRPPCPRRSRAGSPDSGR